MNRTVQFLQALNPAHCPPLQVSIAVDAAVAPRAKLMAQAKLGKPSPTLRDAVMDLMNYPHPLTTLGDVSAYGNDGAISRYHDPDHYTQ